MHKTAVFLRTVVLPTSFVAKYNTLLLMGHKVDLKKERIAPYALLYPISVTFTDPKDTASKHIISAKFDIYSGKDNVYMDPVLYDSGKEIFNLEPAFLVDDTYSFGYKNHLYVVKIIRDNSKRI